MIAPNITLALDEVNGAGGIKGRPVKFVVYDDQSIPQQSVLMLNQAIGRKPAAIM